MTDPLPIPPAKGTTTGMDGYPHTLGSAALTLRGSGALWWAAERLLCVSDLHLGKSGRLARRGAPLLPPYETEATLDRLDAEIAALAPGTVICLGDSFDDLTAADEIGEAATVWLSRMMAGRRWIWIEGNHDPGPLALGGEHRAEHDVAGLTFRHIAMPEARAEVSGHFHPKARLSAQGISLQRPCFLADTRRIVMPAFGTYTGGLACDRPPLSDLMAPDARAVLTGPKPCAIPMPRRGG